MLIFSYLLLYLQVYEEVHGKLGIDIHVANCALLLSYPDQGRLQSVGSESVSDGAGVVDPEDQEVALENGLMDDVPAEREGFIHFLIF